MFGWQIALAAAAFLAVLFWPVFYSRLALRAIALPVLSGLATYFWWRGWSPPFAGPDVAKASGEPPAKSMLWFSLAGLMAGLSIHTYMASRAVPIFFVLFVLYLLLFHRPALRARWTGVGAFFLVFGLIALPLLLFLANNPGAEFRISEVDAPLRALLAGDFGPVLGNAGQIALMFGLAGDPLWRQGIAGQPIFGPLLALVFYLSLPLALWRWRDERYAFLLLWLATAVLPSMATVDAPSTIRIVNLLPVLMLFPLLVIHKSAQLSTAQRLLSTRQWITGIVLVMMIMWGFQAWRTIDGLWRTWPANEEVQFVWQSALTDAAAFLDDNPDSGPVAVGGWTPDTMDAPTMDLTLRREDLSLRFFDPTQSLILPGAPLGQTVRIVRPAILPLAPALESLVAAWAVPVDNRFALYQYGAPASIDPAVPQDELFGDEVRLLGYDVVQPCQVGRADPCNIVTYWQVAARPAGDRRFYLHVTDESGAVVVQDDRAGAPAAFWQPGDIVVQQFSLPSTAGELRLGVYDPATNERLLTAAGSDHVTLAP